MGRKNSFDLSMVDRYCLSMNPVYDVIPLKITFRFESLTREEKEDLREFANVEDGVIERWILLPDTTPLSVLSFAVEKAFGLPPFVTTSSFVLDEEEQKKIFSGLEESLLFSGSIFDNPIDSDYIQAIWELAASEKNGFPPIPLSMMVTPGVSYSEAQKRIGEEVKDVREKGIDIDGEHREFSSLGGFPSVLREKTKDRDFDWCDELCQHIEIKDVIQRADRSCTDMKRRFRGQRSTAEKGRRKGQPFCHRLYMCTFLDDSPAYEFEIERPSDISPLLEDGYLTIEDYLDSVRYVSREISPDLICKKGYDLFLSDEKGYYDFIMLLHSPMMTSVMENARAMGWNEPSMDLRKVFRG